MFLGVAEVLLNAIGFGESLEDAVSARRLSPDRLSNTVHYEGGSGIKTFHLSCSVGYKRTFYT